MNLSRGFLLALILITGVIAFLMVVPYLQYVLMAILLAYVLFPLHRRLMPRIGRTWSAVALLVAATVAIIIPFVLAVRVVVSDVISLAERLEAGDLQFDAIGSQIEEATGQQVDLASMLGVSAERVGGFLLGNVGDMFGLLTHGLIGIGLTVFILYYLLRDGDRLVEWIRSLTPLPDIVQDDLYTEVNNVTWAVLAGHVFIAIVQGAVAGIGLVVTGIPNAIFWTMIMIVLALLPVIGAFLVWGPAAVYLAITGDVVAAVALAIYGTIVVGVTDDYLRPIVVNRRTEVSPAVIILGVVGGLSVIGFMGLFFGPIVLGVLKASLSVFDEHYERLGRI